MIGEWLASIAQPDAADWVTVAAYLLAAAMSLRAALSASMIREARECRFWKIVAGLLIFLAINELLDLQTLLTIAGRAQAKADGWYGSHRAAQYAFVIALAVAATGAGLAMLWLTRRADFAVRVALVGLAFIGTFVLLRAASFHHLDDLLGGGAPQFNWGSVQEMVGIAVVAYAAARYPRSRRHIGS